MLQKKLMLFALLILLFLTSSPFGQTRDTVYQNKWSEIDTLIISGNLTKTALVKVNACYLEAKKDDNTVQQIKCLIYRLSLEEKVS